MTLQSIRKILLLAAANALLAGCASNTAAHNTGVDRECPSGQVLVCKGGETKSRIKDSKLNESDICICRQQGM